MTKLHRLSSRARRGLRGLAGLGAIEPPGFSDITSYPIPENVMHPYVDEVAGNISMEGAFVDPAQIQTLGPATIEDSEFKDVGAPVEGVEDAKTFSGLALVGLAALGYFIFLRK